MATVLIYLSASEEGGETVFPLEGEHGLDRLPTINYSSCEEGLRVCPLQVLGLPEGWAGDFCFGAAADVNCLLLASQC